jgi:hypothetical protein
MKKFGFGKKKKEDKESSNPYAAQPVSDPYAIDHKKNEQYGIKPSAYQQAKQAYAPPGHRQDDSRPSYGRGNSYGAPEEPQQSSPPPAYSSDRYGSGDGYGSNRYDTGSSRYGGPSAPTRSGGYGGLGRVDTNDTAVEEKRDALFGDARERAAKKQQEHALPEDSQPGGGYGANDSAGGSGSASYGGYGKYQEREMTAEEEEEEDIQATKQQMRFMKQEDVSSTRNALRIAAQAEETGRATLARLGAQGERIHNTEKNLDLAANHNRIAEEKARELKTLNKSMFAVHVANPFTSSTRKAARDQAILDKHHDERIAREETRAAAFGSQQRMEGAFRELQPGDPGYRRPAAGGPTKQSLAERSKYQFEADSEDEELENEIDNNLDALAGAAGRLNLLARVTGQEVDEQNKHIDRIIQKSDKVDDQILMNRARLDRIH